jgi:phosphohistidine phosphatase
MTTGGRDARRQLVLVRHAKSSWDDPTVADHDRPLARRGRKALDRMRAYLEDRGVAPDVILCSSALRTRETLEGIRDGLSGTARVEVEDRLYGAGAEELLARLARLDDDVAGVMVVGHNPGVADVLEILTGTPQSVPTGAIAVLSFTGPWRDVASASVTLDSLWRPRPPR